MNEDEKRFLKMHQILKQGMEEQWIGKRMDLPQFKDKPIKEWGQWTKDDLLKKHK